MKDPTTYLNQWLEIDKTQFLQNVKSVQSQVRSDIAAVVKGNGYGHNMYIAASLFREAGINRFCTYHPHNALQLKKIYPELQIMAMGAAQVNELESIFEAGVELFVWDASFINPLIKASNSLGFPAYIHLEVETGMYRTGIHSEEVIPILDKIEEARNLEVKGICTHFSGADEEDNLNRIQQQYEKWKRLRKEVARVTDREFEWHGPNSAAALYLPSDSFTFARLGLLLYGFFPSDYSKSLWPEGIEHPQPALSFKSRVCGSNFIPKGEYSGYGQSWQAPTATSLSIVPVGYGDGFPRKLSNQWCFKVDGVQLQNTGRINMNLSVFLNKEDPVKQQKEVTLIDRHPPFDWYEAAKVSERFLYELLAGLPLHISRVVSG